MLKYAILTKEFVDSYKHKQVPWGFNGLGEIVYKRCVTVETPILCGDLMWRKAGDLAVGTEILGFEENLTEIKRPRHFVRAFITHNSTEEAEVVEIELEDGTLLYSTPDHSWLAYTQTQLEWVEACNLISKNQNNHSKNIYCYLPKCVSMWEPDTSYEGGYLAAAFDGEGSLDRHNCLSFTQVDNEMLATVKAYLDLFNFKYSCKLKKTSFNNLSTSFKSNKLCYQIGIYSNTQVMRFLGMFQPKRLLAKYLNNIEKLTMRRRDDGDLYKKVIRVTPIGKRKIAVISTTSKTHITAGFPSHNTYSRIKANGEHEEWYETIARCIEGAQKIGAEYTVEEAKQLFDLIFNLKCTFAGRMLWQLGTTMVDKFFANGLLNCWAVAIRKPADFCFVFENLMLGGGVGVSVKREDVYELPKVKEDVLVELKNTKDASFIVPDSREGWVELLQKVLDAYFVTGKGFSYSTILIRAKGDPINGFGGTASGPRVLEGGIEKIGEIFKNREGKKLRSIDAADICTIIGSVVVAGNTRRSALLIMGDPDDVLFIKAKRWDLGNIPNYRALANYTINADDYSHIMENVWDGYGGNGEPYGFFNQKLSQTTGRLGEKKKDNCVGLNPCFSEDTLIITNGGTYQIKDLVGKEVSVWDGLKWVKCDNFRVTGENQQLLEIELSSGATIKVTPKHKIILADSSRVKAMDLKLGDVLIPSAELEVYGDIQAKAAYLKGFLIGDGHCDAQKANTAHLWLYSTKYSAQERLVASALEITDLDINTNAIEEPGFSPESYDRKGMCGLAPRNAELAKYCNEYKQSFPYETLNWCKHAKLDFIAGVMDADGSVCNSPRGFNYQLSSVHKNWLRGFQTLLHTIGVRSTLGIMKEAGEVDFHDGYGKYETQESHRLTISQIPAMRLSTLVNFSRLMSFEYKTPKYKLAPRNTKVVSIRGMGMAAKVYCCTVDSTHSLAIAAGVQIGQCGEITLANYECCNLVDIFLNNITSQDELILCSRLLYKAQKAICAMKFIHEETARVAHKNFRIGQGVTGIYQSLDKLDWLSPCYEALRTFDVEWSAKRGWPNSIKLTTAKPSGSVSLLAGATPGVHPAFAKYHIRRIRVASTDPLVNYCRAKNYKIEYVLNFDGTEDRETVVISFPCTAGDKTKTAGEVSAIEQMEMIKRIQTIWADNAVSCTVYYRKEELDGIRKWLKENYKENIKSISFLLHKDHGFAQAPYEEITADKYHELLAGLKLGVKTKDLGGQAIEGLECAGGSCPIK